MSEEPSAVDLAEFNALRAEILSRMQITTTIIFGEISAVGAALSLVASFPEVALALAWLSSMLWLLWLDHAAQVHKIAAYVGVNLAARLRGTAGRTLEWEAFYRELDAGGDPAHAVLKLDGRAPRLPQHVHIGRYVGALFTVAALALLVIYTLRLVDDHEGLGAVDLAWRAVLAAIVLALLAFASVQSRRYDHLVATVGAAIRLEEERRRATAAETSSSS